MATLRSHPIASTAKPSNALPCLASRLAALSHGASSPTDTDLPPTPHTTPTPLVSTTPATATSPTRTRRTSPASATTALAKSPPGPSTTNASNPPNSSHTEAVPDAPTRFHHARILSRGPPRTQTLGPHSSARLRSFISPGMTRLPSGAPRRARRRFQRSPAETSVLADTPSTLSQPRIDPFDSANSHSNHQTDSVQSRSAALQLAVAIPYPNPTSITRANIGHLARTSNQGQTSTALPTIEHSTIPDQVSPVIVNGSHDQPVFASCVRIMLAYLRPHVNTDFGFSLVFFLGPRLGHANLTALKPRRF